jgi:hypothetical protein
MNTINSINTQTPDKDCLSDSDSYAYETNQTQTQTQTHTHTLLNKRYEELRTQILELGSLESLGSQSPLSPSSATQWWEQWERGRGQIGEEFNIITQQGMVSWLEVWLELKPIIRAGAGDRNIDIDTHTDTAVDVNIGKGSIENLYKISLMQRLQKEKINKPGQGRGQDTKKKSNGEGWGTQDRGDRDSGMILDYPGALVGVLSDMVLNAINVAHLNNKYNT